MKASELRNMNVAEIIEKVELEKKSLALAKLNHAVSPAENTTLLRKSRRSIARMLTILAQKQKQ